MTGRRFVTSPANERGGHARPRRPFAPRPRDNGRHDNGAEVGRPGGSVPGPAAVVPGPGDGFPPSTDVHDHLGVTPGSSSPGPGPSGPLPGTPGPPGPVPGTPGGFPAGLVPSPSAEPSGHALTAAGDLAGLRACRTSGVPACPRAWCASRPRARTERHGPPAAAVRGRPPAPGAGRSARHGASSPARKASAANRRAKRSRIAAVAIVVVGVLVIGLATGFGSELSAEPTAQSFLLAWQQQQYAAAGALTTAAAAPWPRSCGAPSPSSTRRSSSCP